MRQAERAARELRDHVDTLITIPNQRLLSFVEQQDAAPRVLQDRRRRAAAGDAGHLGPDQLPGRDQPRLRGRQEDHVGHGPGADGDGDGGRGEPRRPRGAGGDLLAAPRGRLDRGRARHPDEHHGRDRPDALRGQRGGRDHPPGGRPRGGDPLRLRPRRVDGAAPSRSPSSRRDSTAPTSRTSLRPRRSTRAGRAAARPPPFLRGDDSGGFGPNASSTRTTSTSRRCCAARWTETSSRSDD